MEKNNTMELTIVVPVFNEQEIIFELHERLKKSAESITPDYELIFINDGSKDLTRERLLEITQKNPRAKYISFSRNFGHQIAVSAGLDHSSGKAVAIIDGDLQDPPELIPEMYAKLKEGYKVVYAKRKQRLGDSLFKKTTAKLFYRILHRITSIDIPLDTGDFRIIDKEIVNYLKKMKEPNKFLRGQIAWIGMKSTYVEFVRDERKFGESGYPLKKMLRFALDGITAFSDTPLKIAITAGFIFSFLAFLVILFSLYSHYILQQTLTGWTSLMVSIMFIGGVQLMALGIIGEYISRIIHNVRERPLYVIEDTNIPEEEDGK